VTAAGGDLFKRFKVVRMYCDPPGWATEIDQWELEHGEAVIRFETYRPTQMHGALERFVNDLANGSIKHDGCPVAARHIGNAVKSTRRNDTYVLAKASKEQKIDCAMCRVLAHEARADAIAGGWSDRPTKARQLLVIR
jgi:phage terminase large subunit-like protein